ncbi:MAG: acylneuraminate cytidylyltransferase family protein [Anaerolineae bacterium]|nr:MAG: acylneuraminate cytidylyltransferase family protein [Anaerolineae bacterium]
MAAPSVIALLPMRHSSERVPGKNYRPLAGKPLYQHVLESLLACPEITQVVVDTDSPVILEGLEQGYPQVARLLRPESLRDGLIPMNDILLHDTAQVPGDFYLQTHSTNPLLRAATISRAIQTFLEQRAEYDSLFSVTRLHTRLYDEAGNAVNHNPAELLRTQDLPPIYEENSCIYIFTRENLVRRNHRLGERPLMFEIPREEAVDIDEEMDFKVAEYMMLERMKSENQ